MHKRYERLGLRFGRWVAAGVLLCLAAVAGMVWLFLKKPALPRFTVVVAGDPVVVWSWDRGTRRGVRITLPAATVIDAVGGYGKYSLEALWRLGDIENQGGTMLEESLQEAFGLPIDGYVGPKGSELSGSGDAPLVPAALTLAQLPFVFLGFYRTNVRPATLLSLSLAAAGLRPDAVAAIALDKEGALVSQQLADGTTVATPDASRLDVLFGTLFEDGRVRSEGLSVAVYNTTDMSSLGGRAGKLLGRLGVFVVRVANDTPPVERCVVRGSKKALASATARISIGLLGCGQEEGTPEVADLEIRVGTAYEARFLPAVPRER